MILLTTDRSGAKKFFAGFFADNSICWTTHEVVALEKNLAELTMIVYCWGIEEYTIRERLSASPTFYVTPIKGNRG